MYNIFDVKRQQHQENESKFVVIAFRQIFMSQKIGFSMLEIGKVGKIWGTNYLTLGQLMLPLVSLPSFIAQQ